MHIIAVCVRDAAHTVNLHYLDLSLISLPPSLPSPPLHSILYGTASSKTTKNKVPLSLSTLCGTCHPTMVTPLLSPPLWSPHYGHPTMVTPLLSPHYGHPTIVTMVTPLWSLWSPHYDHCRATGGGYTDCSEEE